MGTCLLLAAAAGPAGCRPGAPPESPSSSPPAAGPGLRFEPAPHGPDFTHRAYPSPARYFPETMGSGVAVLDYDGDGLPDLFFPNGRPLDGREAGQPPALFRNEGQARFRRVSGDLGLGDPFFGMGCAAADFDNDGDTDLYCTAALGPARLYRNRLRPEGVPGFEEIGGRAGVHNEGRWGTSAAWLDYDGDGLLDLYVCNYVRYRGRSDELPCYAGSGVRTYCTPQQYEGEPSRLFRGRPGGTFTDVTRDAGLLNQHGKALGVVVWDFDGNGYPDLCVANDTEPVQLFLNQGDGTFRERGQAWGIAVAADGTSRGSMGIDAGPGPGGAAFLAFTNFWAEGAALYRMRPAGADDLSGDWGLQAATRDSLGFGVRLLDADNDGSPELLLLNGHVFDNVALFHSTATHAQRPALFRLAGGRAVPVPMGALDRPVVGRGLAAADFDADGRLDLVATECNGPARVWLNRTPAAGGWLGVRLEGRRANRDGLGARVEVEAEGARLFDYCRSGGSYLSESWRELRFGLGSAKRVDRVTVRWPGGTVDTLASIPGNTTVTIREGETARGKPAAGAAP